MPAEPVIGIDLGTTNSEVAVVSRGQPEIVPEDGNLILPSCVGVDADGRIIVGRQALNQLAAAPERTVSSVKRRMGSEEPIQLGEQEYLPQEISAFVLKSLKERAEAVLGQNVERAVITVPAYFTDAQRQATRDAGRIAGLKVERIINEPTAAALAYESGTEAHRKVLVYDLGGGTFDVSVVSMEAGIVEVLASAGDNELGGNDFDDVIVNRLNEHIEATLDAAGFREDASLQARLRRAAERAKIELSSDPYTLIQEDHVATVDGVAKHLTYELSRDEFESMIEDMLARTMQSVSTALTDANVVPSELDRVLLVGGSTRIPMVTRLLRQRLGHEPHGEVDPDLCVGLGAGVQAGMEMGQDMKAILVDITPYTFGTSALGELYGMPYAHMYVPIIRRNAKLPVTQTEVFYTVHDDQEEVEIEVYQGEDLDALKNVQIGKFNFKGLNRRKGARQEGILFTYSLDLDGLLHVRAVERATGQEIRGVVENAFTAASDEEVAASRERIERDWGDGGEAIPVVEESAVDEGEESPAEEPDESFANVLERAENALESAPGEDREELVNLMEDLRDALKQGRTADAGSIQTKLEELLFYLE